VKKLEDDDYVIVSAAHSFIFKKDGDACELDCGYFFLQKNGKG